MKPDYELAALKATEMLIKHGISAAPVMPLPVFKSTPGCVVMSFTEMSSRIGVDRQNLITMFDEENHDAVTSIHFEDGKLRYLVTYNQRLPLYLLQRALAREMGHIVLGHDGTKPEEVRMAEAYCFAHHLLCPRPLIHAIMQEIPVTVEVLGSITGCYERCLARMRKEPGAKVPKELNRELLKQFDAYIRNFLGFQKILSADDTSALADFGTYMDGYEE